MVGINDRRLDPGHRLISQGVLAEMGEMDPLEAATLLAFQVFHRLAACDWGECSEHDKAANDRDYVSGEGRILGVYRLSLPDGRTVKVYAVHYQSGDGGPSTTIVLPEEY